MSIKIPYKLIARFAISAGVGLIAFNLAGSWYFSSNPFLGILYLAESIIAFVLAVVLYLFSPFFAKLISLWFENMAAKAVRRVVSDFQRLQKERAKALREKEEKSLKNFGTFPLVLDTSAIIDGRIFEVVRLGFDTANVIVPQFVVDELQHIADSEDGVRRQKGRRGLDSLNSIRKLKGQSFKLVNLGVKDTVDKELVSLAKKVKGRLVTVDFNLNKAAEVSGVRVLNINELANALKTVVLPGEKIKVKVIQKGKEESQGVGYLDDGTMVVVEEGSGMVGDEASEVMVLRVIQTAAGKMIFCKNNAQK